MCSQFWKQFFEASANVSLSGYEELANGNETTVLNSNEESTTAHDQTTPARTPHPQGAGRSHDITIEDESSTFNARAQDQGRQRTTNDSVLTDTGDDLSGSTPRPPATKSIPTRPQFANLDSPYEQLRRRELGKAAAEANKTPAFGSGPGGDAMEDDDSELIFQQHTARLPDMSMTPHRAQNTPFGDQQRGGGTANKDPILHRMPDRNYRVGATPHKGQQASGVSPIKWKVTEKKQHPLLDHKGKGKAKDDNRPLWQDSFMSSPEMEVPQLRSAAFMSPIKSAYRGNTRAAAAAYAARSAPRTPGLSVQTPMAGRKTKDVYSTQPSANANASAANATNAGKTPIPKGTIEAKKRYLEEIDWESDSEQDPFGGMSPPKTIQFALPPSKLLQTPAREASKKIVENLLLTAGEMPESSEFSPSVVKMNPDLMDETF